MSIQGGPIAESATVWSLDFWANSTDSPNIPSHQILFSPNVFPCPQVPGMQEILLIGFYQPDEPLSRFLEAAQQEFNLPVRCCAHMLCGVGEWCPKPLNFQQ